MISNQLRYHTVTFSVIQLSLNVLLVVDCVTARCGSPVQPTKMTLVRQRVLSSSEVRASDLEHGGSWVRIILSWFESHPGLRFFLCPLMVDSLLRQSNKTY